jgi:signal transduction histidine kinase
MDEPATPILFIFLICYSLGRWIPDLRGLAGIGVLLAATLVDYLGADARVHNITDVVFVGALSLTPWFVGRITRRLALQSEQLAEQAELLRDEAVRAERDRIARELHDVIAHSLSAMVVQTAAAEDLVRTDPDRAATLLATVAATGRSALAETGRLLHLIRDDADELGLRPAPGLGEVPRLVEEFRSGGLAVEAALDLPDAPVPAAVDVSAYRVVQEALTNALKYADGPVDLRIDSSPHELRISCANRSGTGRTEGSGLGLQGMAERVALLGGTIRHEIADRAFSLDVAIPLGEPAS